MDRRTCPSVVAVKILLLCTAYTDVTKLLPSVLYPNRVDHVCGECVLQAVGWEKMRGDTSLSAIGTETW
ncbi:MAG TPA: hypothetical protein VFQ43_06215 [Nitrososphaera sp.]|nr:hypothetical protein [Nitrososphaera sp.]